MPEGNEHHALKSQMRLRNAAFRWQNERPATLNCLKPPALFITIPPCKTHKSFQN